MQITELDKAATQLERLVDQALNGEEVILARDGQPAVRLTPILPAIPRRVGGQWRGRVRIAEDFDQLPEDLGEAFGVDPS